MYDYIYDNIIYSYVIGIIFTILYYRYLLYDIQYLYNNIILWVL